MNLAKLKKDLVKQYSNLIEVSAYRSSIRLEGFLKTWEDKIDAGFLAAKYGFKSVINDISVEGIEEEKLKVLNPISNELYGKHFDAVIIGGGIIGSSIARELSKYSLTIALLEKESDVAFHTSSRNDGMIHDGFAAKPGTKKAYYNAKGNSMWEPLAKELGIEFSRPGSLILFNSSIIKAAYPIMVQRAKKNKVDGYEYWTKEKVLHEEPNICDAQHGGFFLPSAGILSPYKATVAMSESAIANGVSVFLNTCVTGFIKDKNKITSVETSRGCIHTSCVINAAGNWADIVAKMADDGFFTLHQRRGVDMILDIQTGAYQNHILGMPPLLQIKSRTKGGGLVKTLEGNILVGPTAKEAPGRENYATSPEEIYELGKHLRINKKLSLNQVITYFAGVRPCTYEEDFIIERSEAVVNLVHAAGIQSPGLASAPAIAKDIVMYTLGIIRKEKNVVEKSNFISFRNPVLQLRSLGLETRTQMIKENPLYGRIVCRCEEVSEGEIRDALRSPLEISSLDAVKRRTRAGMGRCHGGFCTPRVLEIIASEKNIPMNTINKKGAYSCILMSETKSEAKAEVKSEVSK